MVKQPTGDLPAGLHLELDPAPRPELRAALAEGIGHFHAHTVPLDTRRFALTVREKNGVLHGGLCASLQWSWMFIEAVWVAEAWRERGLGAALLAAAEDHARAEGCHSAWLDTFQARHFYASRGYAVFGELEDYPAGQVRSFMRKRL